MSVYFGGHSQCLVSAGAVPFLRTNLAQTTMTMGAHNPIYGQTRNPLDPSRSPGGSSCGDAAAVAAGATVIGIGTDFGNDHILMHTHNALTHLLWNYVSVGIGAHLSEIDW